MSSVKVALAGQQITAKAAARLRKLRMPITKENYVIRAKSDAQRGQWVCADCGEPFQNNLMAHGHTKSHRLAWWTGEHFEEP